MSESSSLDEHVKHLRADFMEYLSNSNHWNVCKSTNNEVIYSARSKYFDGSLFRGETVIDYSAQKAYDMVHPTAQYRLQWDEFVSHCKILHHFSQNSLLVHQFMKPMYRGLISPRDTVDLFVQEEDDDYYKVMLKSVDPELVEKVPNYVRGVTYPSGIAIRRQSEDKVQVICLIQAQLFIKRIPRSLVDNAFVGMVHNYMTNLRKCINIPWTPLVNAVGRLNAQTITIDS